MYPHTFWDLWLSRQIHHPGYRGTVHICIQQPYGQTLQTTVGSTIHVGKNSDTKHWRNITRFLTYCILFWRLSCSFWEGFFSKAAGKIWTRKLELEAKIHTLLTEEIPRARFTAKQKQLRHHLHWSTIQTVGYYIIRNTSCSGFAHSSLPRGDHQHVVDSSNWPLSWKTLSHGLIGRCGAETAQQPAKDLRSYHARTVV